MQTISPSKVGWHWQTTPGTQTPTAATGHDPSGTALWIDVVWLVLLAALSSTWCVTAARQIGGTYDETVYMECGLERWRTGSTAGLIRLGTMPLPVEVQTLPLYIWECNRGKPFVVQSQEYSEILPVARLGNLVFWYVLLLYTWVSARALGGVWAGRIAVGFIALEPNLLAHASLATTDIALAAGVVAFLYHFQRGLGGTWWQRVAIPGLFFGVAILTKVSGMVFGVLCMYALVAAQLWPSRTTHWARSWWPGWALLKPHVRDISQIFGIGLVVTFVYCGSDWAPSVSFMRWADGLPEGPMRDCMVWLSENLKIFTNAGLGIVRQFTHNARGHGSYIAGQTHPRALWYYFPLCLSIKSTVPMLLAPLVIGGVWLASKAKLDALKNWALISALALFLFTPLCRVQIGVRFMLPLIVLAVIGLSGVWMRSVAQFGSVGRRRLAAVTLGLMLWSAACSAEVWPHGLCYVNSLWGGTEEGYKQVTDSSYDWGQGLKDLERWQKQSGEKEITIWYFGSDPTSGYAPFRNVPLHTIEVRQPEDIANHIPTRYLAISTTLLYGPYLEVIGRDIRDYFRNRPIVARTMTFLIYEFEPPVRSGTETSEPPLFRQKQPPWHP